MTCKDNCLHYEVCLTAFSSKGMYLGDDAEEMECFKNKADFVKVVRCSKCKYGDVGTFSKAKDGEEEIACYCTLKKVVTNTDSYCPSGRRRDAE